MSYILRFPFKLPANQDIGGLDNPVMHSVHGLTWLFEQKSDLFTITISGLRSEDECCEYSKRIWSGFNWLILRDVVVPIADLTFDQVFYSNDPETTARNMEQSMRIPYSGPIHGFVHNNMLAAYPSNKNIRFIGAENSNFVRTVPICDVLDSIIEGIEIRSEHHSIEDQKLQIALDLFAAFWLENSDNAKLLTLVLALESLMTHPLRHRLVIELLDRWKPEVKCLKEQFNDGSEEFNALDSLEKELLFKKTDSLRRQVRSLVFDALVFLKQDNASDKAREAVWVYDQRSILVHEGKLSKVNLSKAKSTAYEIVAKVLEARFRSFQGPC